MIRFGLVAVGVLAAGLSAGCNKKTETGTAGRCPRRW